jgi:hypothetical protein
MIPVITLTRLKTFFQNKELIGDRGLLPAGLHLDRLRQRYTDPQQRFLAAPTILWMWEGKGLDSALDWIARKGDIRYRFYFIFEMQIVRLLLLVDKNVTFQSDLSRIIF